MHPLAHELRQLLIDTERFFGSHGISETKAERLRQLIAQVSEPGLVSICGRMKNGKSTLFNAWLGRVLAKVGVTETTATINVYRYGQPDDPQKPVRCHFRDPQRPPVWITVDEAHALQTTDAKTLIQAAEIERLVFFLDDERLRYASLADTPGGQSPNAQRREMLDDFLLKKSAQVNADSDAVICLLSDNATEDNERVLGEIRENSNRPGEVPLNILGVLSKADLFDHPDLLAAEAKRRLGNKVHSVTPVSAGLYQAVKELQAGRATSGTGTATEWDWFVATVRKLPREQWEKLVKWSDDWEEATLPINLISPDDKERLHSKTTPPRHFKVFRKMILGVVQNPQLSADEVARQLIDDSRFEPLVEQIEELFLSRGHLIRSHRIANEAWRLVFDAVQVDLPRLENIYRTGEKRIDRARQSARWHPDPVESLDDEIIAALHRDNGGSQPAEQKVFELEKQLRHFNCRFGELRQKLREADHDWEHLKLVQKLRTNADQNQTTWLDELGRLFGQQGLDLSARLPDDIRVKCQATEPNQWGDEFLTAAIEYARDRQQHWNVAISGTPDWRRLEQAAVQTYGRLLFLLIEQQTSRESQKS